MNKFRNEQGASSILVIIMMVVLLVFGLAVLTTSLSNIRLSDRKKAWLTDYYTLEAYVETAVANYDVILKEAELEAIAYLETTDYMDDYMIEGPLTGPLKQQVFALAYHDFLVEHLRSVIAGNDTITLYIADVNVEEILSGGMIQPSELRFDISSNLGDYPKHISVVMEIKGANADNLREDFTLKNRYDLIRFNQWQDAFDYDDAIDFEDPFDPATETPVGGNPFEE